MTVWKYALNFDMIQHVELPIGFQILSIQLQNGKPMLWALVNKNATVLVKLTLRVVHTGYNVSENWRYLATIQLRQGDDPWVAHFFEELS